MSGDMLDMLDEIDDIVWVLPSCGGILGDVDVMVPVRPGGG